MMALKKNWWTLSYHLFIIILLFIGLYIYDTVASNWAQVSGERQTNAAVFQKSPWSRRHGHSVVALDFTEEYTKRTGEVARMIVIGGDSAVQGSEDLRAYPGGGSLRNDVWSTTGISWNVRTNPLKTTKWGDPLPQMIANLTWLQTNSGKRPPFGVTYAEWTACAAAPWSNHPVVGCNDPKKPPGAYLADNMFSPRRNFQAIAFKNEIYVLGGRARDHFPVPEDVLRGGVGTIGPRNARWREFTVLKNDVWRSSDAGASWTLVTPGCLMPQADLTHKAGLAKFECDVNDQCEGDSYCQIDYVNGVSSVGHCVCAMWSAREFHAVAVHGTQIFLSGGYAQVQLGNCGVEGHAARRPSGVEDACGGGYRVYLIDVWISENAKTWKRLTPNAAFTPRGEHAMVSFQGKLMILGGRGGNSFVSAGELVQAASNITESPTATKTSLKNDIYVLSLEDIVNNQENSEWKLHSESAPWKPRAKHVVLVLPASANAHSGADMEDELFLLFGEDDDRVLEDVWSWKGVNSNGISWTWIKDYDEGTNTHSYVSPSSEITGLKILKATDAKVLQDRGFDTINSLLTMTFEETIFLRQIMPICDYIALAKELVSQCTVKPDLFEEDILQAQTVIQGEKAAEEEEAALTVANGELDTVEKSPEEIAFEEDHWDGCSHIGVQYYDKTLQRTRWPDVKGIEQVENLRNIYGDTQETTCKWQPSPRTGHAATVFNGKIFVFGGLTQPDYYENDVWYRKAHVPLAQITKAPISESSDTIFEFICDDDLYVIQSTTDGNESISTSDNVLSSCLFEYHVTNVIEQLVVRNWTISTSTIDVLPWLDGGKYMLRVRAIDAAGNAANTFDESMNMYIWDYVPSLPWGLIIGILAFLGLILVALLQEWHKRRKQAALERHALRRKARKGKKRRVEKDENWRKTYDDAKNTTGKTKIKPAEKTKRKKNIKSTRPITKEDAKSSNTKSGKKKIKSNISTKSSKDINSDKSKQTNPKSTTPSRKKKIKIKSKDMKKTK